MPNNNATNTTRYGYYSEKQKVIAGSVLYTKPDGSTVEVTEISSDPDLKSLWDDMVSVGEVVRYVGRHSCAKYESNDFQIEPKPAHYWFS